MINNFVNQETSVTNAIQGFFNEEFGEVRGIVINGKPYAVGTDIAKCVGYTNPRKALIDHVSENNKIDGGTIRYSILDSLGREQYPIFINEAGIYELISRSKMPKAKELWQWILSDVLPKLRRDNVYYDTIVFDQYDHNSQEAFDNLAEAFQKQKEENDRLRNTIDEQQARINRMKPKEDMYNYFIHSNGFNNTTTIAADYGMDVIDFNNLLAQLRVQYKRWDRWYLYPVYEGRGYTTIQEGYDEFGRHFTFMAWTNKGRQFIYDLLKSEGIMPIRYNNCPFGFRY